MDSILFGLALYLAAMLAVAGFAKLDHPEQLPTSLYSIAPSWSVTLASKTLPWIEIVTAIALIGGISPVLTALTTLTLFMSFLAVKVLLAIRRETTDCGCYGAVQRQTTNSASIVAGSILAILAVPFLWIVTWAMPLGLVWRLAGIALFVGADCWILWKRLSRLESPRFKLRRTPE